MERLQTMFQLNAKGEASPELRNIYQTGCYGLIFGSLYGGFTQNDVKTNQPQLNTKSKVLIEKRQIILRGALKWGLRGAFFTTTYTGIVTMISVYRGQSSIFEYVAAGAQCGALYCCKQGLRGIGNGVLYGAFLGTIAGGSSLLIMKLSDKNGTPIGTTSSPKLVSVEKPTQPKEPIQLLTKEQNRTVINDTSLDLLDEIEKQMAAKHKRS